MFFPRSHVLSVQRLEQDSMGLVVERDRRDDETYVAFLLLVLSLLLSLVWLLVHDVAMLCVTIHQTTPLSSTKNGFIALILGLRYFSPPSSPSSRDSSLSFTPVFSPSSSIL